MKEGIGTANLMAVVRALFSYGEVPLGIEEERRLR